jgi:hypothetical protein
MARSLMRRRFLVVMVATVLIGGLTVSVASAATTPKV